VITNSQAAGHTLYEVILHAADGHQLKDPEMCHSGVILHSAWVGQSQALAQVGGTVEELCAEVTHHAGVARANRSDPYENEGNQRTRRPAC
jgi:hypothetical protein